MINYTLAYHNAVIYLSYGIVALLFNYFFSISMIKAYEISIKKDNAKFAYYKIACLFKFMTLCTLVYVVAISLAVIVIFLSSFFMK